MPPLETIDMGHALCQARGVASTATQITDHNRLSVSWGRAEALAPGRRRLPPGRPNAKLAKQGAIVEEGAFVVSQPRWRDPRGRPPADRVADAIRRDRSEDRKDEQRPSEIPRRRVRSQG